MLSRRHFICGSTVVVASIAGAKASLHLHGNTFFSTPNGVVTDGDSITAGFTDTAGYPARFATLTALPVTNVANTGETLATMDSNYASIVAPLKSPTYTALTMLGGTNDIGSNGGTDLTVRASLLSYCGKARATGFKVYVSTILARADGLWDATKEGYRVAFNTWLRANFASVCDGSIDFASIPEAQDPNNLTWFNDTVHPTDALQQIMAVRLQTLFGL